MVRDKKQPWLKPLRKELSGTQKKKAKKDLEEKAAVLRKQSKKFFQKSLKTKNFQQKPKSESQRSSEIFSNKLIAENNSVFYQENDFEASDNSSKSTGKFLSNQNYCLAFFH